MLSRWTTVCRSDPAVDPGRTPGAAGATCIGRSMRQTPRTKGNDLPLPKGNDSAPHCALNPSLIAARATAASGGFSAAESLTTLLTTESLLFAAFSAGVVLTAPTTRPKRITPKNANLLAFGCVGVLAAVAVAAALAWWQVFGDNWTGASMRTLEALGIAIGIAAQPIVALIVALGSRPPKSGTGR